MDWIRIRGARTHNLKNIDLDLPRNQLIVITGLSGSGKSSLAFDTLFAEGQRRYVESLSAYARQFLSVMEKPDVDYIEGLSPAIAIEQKSTSHNPRSTVGTITEIYDYLRLLFARVGIPYCPDHPTPLQASTISQMVDRVLAFPEVTRIMLLAPVVCGRKGSHEVLLDKLRQQGYLRVRIDGSIYELDQIPLIDSKRKHTIEVVIDRLKVRPDITLRLTESFETALALADGIAIISRMDSTDTADLLMSARFACPLCGYALAELEPRLFSFNNPAGACPTCDGLGVQTFFDPDRIIVHPEVSLAGGAIRGWDRHNTHYFRLIESLAAHYSFDPETPWQALPDRIRHPILYGSGRERIKLPGHSRPRSFEGILPNMQRRYRETDSSAVREELTRFQAMRSCPDCQGDRLNRAARHVFIAEKSLPEITQMPIEQALDFFYHLPSEGQRAQIASRIVREITTRLKFLVDVGLDYLNLARSADTLSGGEAQRIRLASQIGAGLVGVMYVLDEPSIGLHQRDNQRLIDTLAHLRDLGNSVIVVEHDEEAIRAADLIVDIGPGAGVHGGRVIAQGTPNEIARHPESPTGQYLSGRKRIELPQIRHQPNPSAWLNLYGARGNNLKNVDLKLPLGLFTCITGVSGSGKSTLINDTLLKQLSRYFFATKEEPAPFDTLEGAEHLDKVISIDQSPIGRTPRSNPATYTGVFTPIRELFAATPEARSRGYSPGRFSFNVKGGRCEACQGEGLIKVEMIFLADIYVSCDVCHGKRYNRETLSVLYKGENIHEVLKMTVEEALAFFAPVPAVQRKLQTLMEVGLSYITLGQSATTLSGGEAQRIKLAKELSRRATGKTLYSLDEPTTGLHFHDVNQLLSVLHRLRDQGNTVVVIEHNLDVIKTADWIIDIGPEGGEKGGLIIATGKPEEIVKISDSYTGQFLARLL